MADQAAKDPRSLAWRAICGTELTGRVTGFLPKGDLVIASDVELVHPSVDVPFSELYAGIPRVEFREGDRVAFRVRSNWSGPTGRLPDPIRRETLRHLPLDEDPPDLTPLRTILGQTAKLEDVLAAVRAAQTSIAAAEEARQRILVEAEARALAIEGEAATLARAAEERVEAIEAAVLERERKLQSDLRQFEALGGPRFVRAFAPVEDSPVRSSRGVACPPNVVAALQEGAGRAGMRVSQTLARRALVGHAVAAATGQMIVYGGPPGSGKTSTAVWMPRALDMAVEVLPVRPGWLDTADLLGFFDPRNDRFVSAPFLDFVLDAQRSASGAVKHVVVLDEMNIARIENYGADVLSQLEKTYELGQRGELRLYSESVQSEIDRLRIAAVELREEDALTRVGIPAKVTLPDNLILTGTLNNDDHVETLSPKVLDRSLGIRVPALDPSLPASDTPVSEVVFSLDRAVVDAIRARVPQTREKAEELWTSVLDLVDDLAIPSVYVSHRLARVVSTVPAIAEHFDLEPRDVLDDIVCMKVLPWIRFFRGPKRRPIEDLERLRERAASAAFPVAEQEVVGLLADDGDLVQYLR